MTVSLRIRSLALVWAAMLVVGCSSSPYSLPSIPGFGKKAPPPAAPASAASAVAPEPVEEPAPAPVVHRSEGEIKQLLEGIRLALDQGQEDNAQDELQKILASDPSNKVAQGFMRQIKDDPNTLYGRESFAYKVAQGDTLASIAQRFMNDRDQFYGLARYNGIKVPRQLQLGQNIRVPGKARPPTKAPADTKSTSDTKADTKPPEPVAAAAPAADTAAEAAKAERDKKAVVDRTKAARSAMARQDVCGAIANWDAVLKIDPNNLTAQLEKAKAIELKKKLPNAKC